MTKTENFNNSRDLHEMLLLRFEPTAIKMIENKSDIPGNAIYPNSRNGF